jgi:hypothetical protein
MQEFLTAALSLTANPFALAGYIGLGVYSTTTWRAFKYGVLWGLTIQIFVLALGRSDILDFEGLAVQTALRLVGAVVVTMGVHYLYRAMRGGSAGPSGPGAGGAGGPAPRRKTPNLRRVK